MPLYEIRHSASLTDAQRERLAQEITHIHTRRFTVPAAFVHVTFTPYAATQHFVGGKLRTGTINFIVANVRNNASRTEADWEQLCDQLAEAWKNVVQGGAVINGNTQESLTAAFILGNLTAVYEHGFMVPPAGQDKKWLEDNMVRFKEAAAGGVQAIADMLEELKGREEFKKYF